MASAFSRFRGDVEDDLEAQVTKLSKELVALKKSVAKRGAHAYDEARDTASDYMGELRDRMADTLPMVRKQARVVERAARDNPTTALVVGVALVGLLGMMLSRR